MSQFVKGQKVLVEVEFDHIDDDGDARVEFRRKNGYSSDDYVDPKFLRPMPPEPSPVDPAKIAVGDRVHLLREAKVTDVFRKDDMGLTFWVAKGDGSSALVDASEIVAHFPAAFPTQAEFAAMTHSEWERWRERFAAATKGK